MWITRNQYSGIMTRLSRLEKDVVFCVDPYPLYPGEGEISVKTVVLNLMKQLGMKLVHTPPRISIERKEE